MATPRTPNQKKQYTQLNIRLAKYGKLVEQLYEKFNREAARIAMRTDYDPDAGKMFHFQDFPQTRDAVQKLLSEYMSDMTGTINRTTSIEWENSNEFQDLVANKVLKAYGVKAKDGTEYERYFQVNSDHLKAFQTRTVNGMNLSRRVWNLKEQYKQELEMGLSVGIEKGSSAASLAKQMKQYLNEPDKLFRRVRDKFGNLQLSKNAKAYHPGRGVYRSSFKNAMRLTRSETNMAYRTAEQTRWRQFDFVVGYEIKLSQSHPCHDVCDELAGKYPKDFVWAGWHPMDLCYCVSILKTQDEFWRDLGEEKPGESENEVTDVPEAFKNWVKDNEERIETAEKRGTQPYFIRDNKEYIQGILKPAESESDANNNNVPQEVKKTALEIAAERHAARSLDDVDRIQRNWNRKLIRDLDTLSDRVAGFRDTNFVDLMELLREENRISDYGAFKTDYIRTKKYLNDWIERETALIRKMMQENPAFAKNMEELAKKLGIKQGEYMTFHEADELRGNPNYSKSSAYRVNCQTCVVANELRRRGFNVEALANTKGSKLETLSYKTNEIWLDANGNIPEKTIIGAEKNAKGRWEKTVPNRRQLLKKIEDAVTEDGRYHVDWYWSSSNSGHIITLEKVGNTLRYYDPQNGKIISNFYDYIDDIRLSHGIRLLRVDNLRINAEYASQILGKSGSKAVGGVAGKSSITSGKESIADLIKMRNEAQSNIERVRLIQEIIKNDEFKKVKSLSTKDNSIYTLNPADLKAPTNQKELPKNLSMAKKMVKNGYDAYLLSNPNSITSADFIFVKDGKSYYVEGKLSSGKNSLDHNLSKGAKQSDRVLIDLTGTKDTNYIFGELKSAYENNLNLQEVMLLKGSRLILVKRIDIFHKKALAKFKSIWEQRK